MDFTTLLGSAVEALTLNKLRTALATLGIVIGIGSVIALVSLGQASQKSVESQIQSLGSNLLTVIPGASSSTGGVRGAAGSLTTLTYADAQAIQNSGQVPDVSLVSPELSRRAQVTSGKNNSNVQVVGVVPAYEEVHNISMQSGNFVTQQDVDGMSKVAVIGPQVASDLYGDNSDAIGKTIRISGQSFRVIGVTVSKGGSGFFNQDDIVFIPLLTAQKQIFGESYLSDITLQAKSADVMTAAENEVGYLLLSRHKISNPAQADFTIQSQNDILGAATQVTGTFTALLSGIAAISLLVGGIGIMNIMLVTVTERTREIGLRKSLGAKKKIVIAQFLAESIILTFTGGILGMLLGSTLSFVLSKIISLPFVVSLSSVGLAMGVSAGIGILFGWYPAQKAANLSPIEALRYE
ncbi:ABC transporter permease [Patescibacteria group bacterium]|nr:ABC transporter permease [Patescibacteria group bacterium]MCL5409677.1 ABC transporter permease [Patescibacteria group bacterium]